MTSKRTEVAEDVPFSTEFFGELRAAFNLVE